jgi:hypothetical protein
VVRYCLCHVPFAQPEDQPSILDGNYFRGQAWADIIGRRDQPVKKLHAFKRLDFIFFMSYVKVALIRSIILRIKWCLDAFSNSSRLQLSH